MAVANAIGGFGDEFRAESLYRERYVVIVPPGHRFTQLDTVRLVDQDGEDYVDRLACEMREMVMKVLGQRTSRSTRSSAASARLGAGDGDLRPRLRLHAGIFGHRGWSAVAPWSSPPSSARSAWSTWQDACSVRPEPPSPAPPGSSLERLRRWAPTPAIPSPYPDEIAERFRRGGGDRQRRAWCSPTSLAALTSLSLPATPAQAASLEPYKDDSSPTRPRSRPTTKAPIASSTTASSATSTSATKSPNGGSRSLCLAGVRSVQKDLQLKSDAGDVRFVAVGDRRRLDHHRLPPRAGRQPQAGRRRLHLRRQFQPHQEPDGAEWWPLSLARLLRFRRQGRAPRSRR